MAHDKSTTKTINGTPTQVTPYCTEDDQVWPCDAVADMLSLSRDSLTRPDRSVTYTSTLAEGQAKGKIGASNPRQGAH